jgi:hypothetical protein
MKCNCLGKPVPRRPGGVISIFHCKRSARLALNACAVTDISYSGIPPFVDGSLGTAKHGVSPDIETTASPNFILAEHEVKEKIMVALAQIR